MTPAVTNAEVATGRRGAGPREIAAVVIAAAGEAVVAALSLVAHGALWPALLLHVLVVTACALVLFFRRAPDADLAVAFIATMLIAIAGPAGALPLLASLPFVSLRQHASDAVEAWYERLARAGKPSATTETYERIVSGRVQRLDDAPPADFLDVIRNGGMEERQRALGLIARHFHPDYAPVLEAALRSPEPVVRVQAAAVVARVREDLKVRVARLSSPASRDFEQALADAGELRSLQDCPLISRPQQIICREAAQRLMHAALKGGPLLTQPISLSGSDARATLEDFLIAERRFKDLRVFRRVSSATSTPLRVMRRRRPAAERAA